MESNHTDRDTRSLTPPPRRGLPLLFRDHHHRIEALSNELLATAYTDDSRELAVRWSELEAEILGHIAAEEEVLLPAYAHHAPEDARQIRDDHARLQALLMPTGVEVELHASRTARLRQLIEGLHAHAAHEDAGMYAWAERNLAEVAQHLLFARIGRWFGSSSLAAR